MKHFQMKQDRSELNQMPQKSLWDDLNTDVIIDLKKKEDATVN